ncbi:MAG: PqqD family protein [Clostridia bacterium]|nr:PqqD family protein [Clostridia bacterium]MBR6650768.1 PqqD family protein [Clostridia bacterium]
MKKKEVISKNYLEKIPIRAEWIQWDTDENGMVTLYIENKGIMKKLTQILLNKPKVSHIHFDKTGSFVWPIIDGEKNILSIGKEVDAHFGDAADPLYERLAKYFQVLDSYGFVEWRY